VGFLEEDLLLVFVERGDLSSFQDAQGDFVEPKKKDGAQSPCHYPSWQIAASAA
jgi:hypothetical protein